LGKKPSLFVGQKKMESFETRQVDQLVAELEATVSWLAEIGVEIGSGRVTQYRKVAHEWASFINGDKKKTVDELYPRVAVFAYEVPALLNIHRSFKGTPRGQLKDIAEKLRKAVQGPWSIDDESITVPNHARNFLFEAITAAHVHSPATGSLAILDSPSDTGFVKAPVHAYVECKRLLSANGIEANLKKACKQLVVSFERRPRTMNRGLIAVDVSKIIRPPGHLLDTKTNDEIGKASSSLLVEFIDEHMNELQERLRSSDRRIVGLMVYFSTVAVARMDQLFVNVAKWSVVRRRGITPADDRFLSELPSTFAPPYSPPLFS
jgi:hypothetical protein